MGQGRSLCRSRRVVPRCSHSAPRPAACSGTSATMLCVRDFEEYAMESLAKPVREYYRGGADEESTLQLNKECIRRLRIRPRVLRGVAARTMGTTVFGVELQVPFGVSPTAFQAMAHPDGERASAKAVADLGGVFCLSSLSNFSLEEVMESVPEGVKWFQLYINSDRALSELLIRRAEEAGYRAIVLTVDAPVTGRRLREVRCGFKLPKHLRAANFDGSECASGIRSALHGTSKVAHVSNMQKQGATWDDVVWLKRTTRLAVVVKGVLTEEDAELAVEAGADAVFVSNHGGRQLDGAPATIEALPEVVAAVRGRCPVFVDGGFSHGSSIFKGLALGAKMVFVGRPVLWGLSHSGYEGVTSVLSLLKSELDRTMALAGCKSTTEICRRMVAHEYQFYRNFLQDDQRYCQ